MAVDKRAIAKSAQLLASKGQYNEAIEEWKKLLTDSPQDGSTYNSIGDLYLKQNSRKDACAAYLQAAGAFKEEGSTLKAIATYKKVIKIDPSHYEIYRFLGDLNAERGLLSSAVADYLTLGKFYLKEGKPKEALELYRKICNQDPSNYSAREQMAELCLNENLQEEAVQTYLQLGRERSAQFRREEARNAYEAVLKIDPNNREAEQYLQIPLDAGGGGDDASQASVGMGGERSSEAPNQERMLGEALRRMNDGEFIGSEAILTQLLNAEPGNPEVCQLLSRLHLKRGDVAVAMNEYQFLAGAAMRADDLDQAESLIQEFLEVQPDSPAILELLGAVYEKRDDLSTAAQHYGRAIELLLAHPDPDLPGLQDELYDRIKEIAPTSPLLQKFAAAFGGAPAPAAVPDLEIEEILEAATPPATKTLTDVAPEDPPAVEAPIEIIQPTEAEKPAPEIPSAPPLAAASIPSPTPVVSKPVTAPPPVARTNPTAPSAPRVVARQATPAPVKSEAMAPAPEPRGKEADVDTRYILGKAYKDMGLYPEAIEELRVSLNSNKWFLDSCIQLATCLKFQGMPKRAMACLEHALGDPRGKKGEQVAMARYELGLLYEMEGQLEKALHIFESIPAVNDSLQRMESLKSGKVKQGSMAEGLEIEKKAGDVVMAGGEHKGVKKRRISYL